MQDNLIIMLIIFQFIVFTLYFLDTKRSKKGLDENDEIILFVKHIQ